MSQGSDSLRKPTMRSATWAYLRRYTDRDKLAESRILRPIAHRILSPELWRFTRRNVPRGVALGLFAGFVIPVGQIFLALVLAFTVRANVPIASAATLSGDRKACGSSPSSTANASFTWIRPGSETGVGARRE